MYMQNAAGSNPTDGILNMTVPYFLGTFSSTAFR
jgi:hypothetical protein